MKLGEIGVNLQFFVSDANGVVDLSTATSAILRYEVNGNAVQVNCTYATNPKLGEVDYLVQANDFQVAGVYTAEVTVFFGSNKFISNTVAIYVDPSI